MADNPLFYGDNHPRASDGLGARWERAGVAVQQQLHGGESQRGSPQVLVTSHPYSFSVVGDTES